jgi:hypothetical protein
MILKYYSNWIIPLSVIWIILYKINSPLVKYFNPYYALIVICIGYILFSLYLLFYKDYKFNVSFIVLFMVHYLPLHYMMSNTLRVYAIETLVITFFLYTLYLGYIGKDVYTVYASDKHPKDIKEIINSIV